MQKLSFFAFFLILITSSESLISIRVVNYRIPNPRVEIDCFRGDLNCSETISIPSDLPLGHQSQWTVPPGVLQLQIECKSEGGQVKWEYGGVGAFPNIDIESSRIVDPQKFGQPSSYTHVSTMTFGNVSDQITGPYTCRNIDHPEEYRQFHLFSYPEEKEMPEEGASITLTLPKSARDVVIPCMLRNLKGSRLGLYKKIKNYGYKRVSNWRYDPFRGFYIQLPSNNLEIDLKLFGEYVCKLENVKNTRRKPPRSERSRRSPFGSSPEEAGFSLIRKRGHFPRRTLTSSASTRRNAQYPLYPRPIYSIPPRRGVFNRLPVRVPIRRPFPAREPTSSEEDEEDDDSQMSPASPPRFRVPQKPIFRRPPQIRVPVPPGFQDKVANTMNCILKKFWNGFGSKCEEEAIPQEKIDDTLTLLEVKLIPEADYKFLPLEKIIFAPPKSPFKLQWNVKLIPGIGEWDWSGEVNSVKVKHSLPEGHYEIERISPGRGWIQISGLAEGDSGQIDLEYYDQVKSSRSINTWRYEIISESDYNGIGLRMREFGGKYEIICQSATGLSPKMTFTPLNSTNGCKFEELQDRSVLEDCGPGCTKFETIEKAGRVKCIGVGVDKELIFPPKLPKCSGKPIFIERGSIKKIPKEIQTIGINQSQLVIPCPINNPFWSNVNLFRAGRREFHPIDLEEEEFESLDIKFDPKVGFTVRGSLEEMDEFIPKAFKCSSSDNPRDFTDSVIIHYVKKSPEVAERVPTSSESDQELSEEKPIKMIYTKYKLLPEEILVHGKLPRQFSWESKEELEIDEDYKTSAVGEFWSGIYSDRDAKYPYVGSFDLTRLKGNNTQVDLKVRSKKSGQIIHTWTFRTNSSKRIQKGQKSSEVKKSIFTISDSKETNYNKLTVENNLVLSCASPNGKGIPKLRQIFCNAPNSCEIMKSCFVKDCYPEDAFDPEACPNRKNCAQLKVSTSPTPFSKYLLQVKCSTSDGLEESKQILTQNDPLITSAFYKADDNALTLRIPYELEWELGDIGEFQCFAKRNVFSHGIKWGVEDGTTSYFNGDSDSNHFLRNYGDFKSSFTLKMDSLRLKRIFCFAPLLNSSTKWSQLSHPIFVHPKGYKDCRIRGVSPKPTIRVSYIEEFSSTFKDYASNRVDDLPWILLRRDNSSISTSKNFELISNGDSPLEWTFEGVSPASSLLVNSYRTSSDFFNPQSICYTSKLSRKGLNQLSINDTGLYAVKVKDQPWKSSSVFIFVPNDFPPFLANHGKEIRVKWNEEKLTLPCQVTNPEISVQLYKFEHDDVITDANKAGNLQEIDNKTISFDPRFGFTILRPSLELRNTSFICSTNQELVNDTLTINIVDSDDLGKRTAEKDEELLNSGEKFDDPIRVGLWHDGKVFKCQAKSHVPPRLVAFGCSNPSDCELRGQILTKDNENVYKSKSICGVGCSQLRVPQHESAGSVLCQGRGVQTKLQFFQGKKSKIVTNLDDLEEYQKIEIQVNLYEGGLRDFKVGEQIKIICKANQYFYSHGLVYAIERRDGTMKFLDDLKTKEEDFYPNEIQSRIKLPILDSNIKRVWCFAPLFDSTQWRNSSLPINIIY